MRIDLYSHETHNIVKKFSVYSPPNLFSWKTQSWPLRIFQTVMGFSIINVYLAYKYLKPHRPTLRNFTNEIAEVVCRRYGAKDVGLMNGYRAKGWARAGPTSIADRSRRAPPWHVECAPSRHRRKEEWGHMNAIQVQLRLLSVQNEFNWTGNR